jgi:hypothetical protein
MPICETISSAIERIEEDIKLLQEYPKETWNHKDKLYSLGSALIQLGVELNKKGYPYNEENAADWEDD